MRNELLIAFFLVLGIGLFFIIYLIYKYETERASHIDSQRKLAYVQQENDQLKQYSSEFNN